MRALVTLATDSCLIWTPLGSFCCATYSIQLTMWLILLCIFTCSALQKGYALRGQLTLSLTLLVDSCHDETVQFEQRKRKVEVKLSSTLNKVRRELMESMMSSKSGGPSYMQNPEEVEGGDENWPTCYCSHYSQWFIVVWNTLPKHSFQCVLCFLPPWFHAYSFGCRGGATETGCKSNCWDESNYVDPDVQQKYVKCTF